MNNRLQQLQQLLTDSPNDSFLLFALAKEYEKMNQIDEALQFYNQLHQSDPAYVGLYYHLGKLHQAQGRLEDALTIFDEGIEQAKQQRDQHSLSELMGARMELVE